LQGKSFSFRLHLVARTFYLRHEKAAADLEVLKSAGTIIDLSPELTDFHQTAAAIAALDLVISIDTSVANLCGAMGRHDWVLTANIEDYRWSHGWYPSMKAFRHAYCQWEPVLDEVIEQLKARAEDNAKDCSMCFHI